MRSPHPHARIAGIDARAARAHPQVHAVLTLADLSPFLSQERLPLGFRTDELPPDITPFVLARDEVAFVGEAVAVVIAQTRYSAEDAAALVDVDYEPLPAVSDCRAALAPGAPCAHLARPGNLLIEFTAVLRRRGGRVCGRPPSRERPSQAASRRRTFHRGPRRACRLRRQRGQAHAVDLDPARPRGPRLSDATARPRREWAARRRTRRRRRLRRQVPDVSGRGHARRSRA